MPDSLDTVVSSRVIAAPPERVVDTAYLLEPVAGGTRLTTRMRYRVSTHFNGYARPLAKLLVHNFERTALEFYAKRAEMLKQWDR